MHVRNERGIALATAIAALVIIGALVAGAFFVGMQEQRVGRNTIGLQQALAAAEEGAQLRLANWDPLTTNFIAIGDSLAFGDTVSGGAGWYRGSVFRLDTLMFLVRAEGFSPDSLARQSVGMLARLRPVEIEMTASVMTQGITNMLGNNVTFQGADEIPPDWTGCVAPTDTLAGIVLQDDDDFDQGQGDVFGDPPIAEDNTITSSSLTTFGDAVFDDLAMMATLIITTDNLQGTEPSVSGGVCDRSDQKNWGEPNFTGPPTPVTECQSYFPVIYRDGDLLVNGFRGQGILIVDGDLNIQGGMEFTGPVIVSGTVSFAGNGNKVYGGLIAANVLGGSNAFAGKTTVTYSTCAIEKALAGGSVAWKLQERSWVNLY